MFMKTHAIEITSKIILVVKITPTFQNLMEDTVLPAKSDSDMFCLQHYLGLIIDRSLVY